MARKATPQKGSPSPAENAGEGGNASSGTATLPRLPTLEIPAVPVRKDVAPLRVRPPSIPKIAQEERKPYWIGTMPKAPLFTWTSPVSGARFVRNTGKLNDLGKPEDPRLGQVVWLSDTQRDATLQQIAQHVVRPMGGEGRIWPVDYHAYRQDAKDEPLGKYLFMYPLEKGQEHNRPVTDPEPLYREE